MPLASGTDWFQDDSADARGRLSRSRVALEITGDPTEATFVPGPLPPGAPCWDVAIYNSHLARPCHPTQEDTSQPWPVLTGPPQQTLVAQPPRRRQSLPRVRALPGGDVREAPGVPADALPAWLSDAARRLPARTPARAPDADSTPLWMFGAGQPAPPLSWNFPEAPRRRSGQRGRLGRKAEPLPLGQPDVPVAFAGWRREQARRASATCRRIDGAGEPAPSALLQVPMPPIAPPERARWAAAGRRTNGRGELATPPALDAPAYLAALATREQPRRLAAWMRRRALEDGAALWWLAAETTKGLSWGAWGDRAPARARTASLSRAESGILALDASQAALPSWTPTEADGKRRAGLPWRVSEQWAAPPWLFEGSSLIVVAGPYCVVAGQIYVAGAVEGSVETPS